MHVMLCLSISKYMKLNAKWINTRAKTGKNGNNSIKIQDKLNKVSQSSKDNLLLGIKEEFSLREKKVHIIDDKVLHRAKR